MKRPQRIILIASISAVVTGIFAFNRSAKVAADDNSIINIPIIVHVIIDDKESECFEPGANEDRNLSLKLIHDELADLHRDFLLLNTDTAEVLGIYKPIIGNPHINFYLDTTYNTNAVAGIIRVNNPNDKGWTDISPVIDPKKYFNVYIVNNTHSYTSTNHVWDKPTDDAVYLYYCWVGRHYRLLTHETGHWLGLLHLWGTGTGKGDRHSCDVGDMIDDTHPQKNATDGACDYWPPKVSDQSCDGTPSNYNNYMDYSGQRRMFTNGQVKKMRENLFQYRRDMVVNSTSIGK